eukprot:scaffold77472_cov36-Phaeocystis_antarctica.AAC.1
MKRRWSDSGLGSRSGLGLGLGARLGEVALARVMHVHDHDALRVHAPRELVEAHLGLGLGCMVR